MADLPAEPLSGRCEQPIWTMSGGNRSPVAWSDEMTESKNGFRNALGGLIDARGREASRQVSYRMQHQLIGAVTKRP